MTIATGTEARTNVELLYLSIDLRDRPSVSFFTQNANAVSTLADYATNLASGDAPDRWFVDRADLRIVRLSMASPWVTVISDIAANSRPVGYGAAALYGLHRLLQIVMTWQNHRIDLAERRLHIIALREAMLKESVRQNAAAFGKDAASIAAAFADKPSWPQAETVSPGPPEWTPEDRAAEAERHLDRATAAARELGMITAAELISPEDPRATGT